jgi:HicA toxin of bacterial toxin-antitoxin,
VNKKQHKTLELIFKNPAQPNIKWADIESLFANIGAEISEGNGSHVRIGLNKVRPVFHRPHPKPDTDRRILISVRKFLINAGIKP